MTNGPYDSAYFAALLPASRGRARVWQAIVADLNEFLAGRRIVLDLGCGWGDFINNVDAPRRLAVDRADVRDRLDPAVEFVQGEVSDLDWVEEPVDVAFASNLLEHLSREDGARLLDELFRVVRPGGLLILLQPNFRLCYDRYFDDYTHETIYTDVSLSALVQARGFRLRCCKPGYLPTSMRSRLPKSYWLTRLYLALGSPVAAGQMLIVAERPAGV